MQETNSNFCSIFTHTLVVHQNRLDISAHDSWPIKEKTVKSFP
jgi:hypothetical protein